MRKFGFIVSLMLACAIGFGPVAAKKRSSQLVEPSLHVRSGVALTFDGSSGGMDQRILGVLLKHNIKATFFITARWVRNNRKSFKKLISRPDLFEIANHGDRHWALVDYPTRIYGVRSVGSQAGVVREIKGGEAEIKRSGGGKPKWFRGATAVYSKRAIKTVKKLGYKVAGYSVNGDGGATYSAAKAERRVASAKNGDVVIAHINQPRKSAGRGVSKGILALKRRGIKFVRLSD